MKKYYVGAEHIGRAIGRGGDASLCRETIEEATEDARRALIKDPSREAIVVVQIVRVVRLQDPPIIVEDILE